MNDIDLSVVVPVYNVEEYLPRCIDSLLKINREDATIESQNAIRTEIILVDDGSTDKSGSLCDEYADRYEQVKVVHRKNGGLSAARNSGLDIAKGKYVLLVDSDDYIEPDTIGELLRTAKETESDIVNFGLRQVRDNETDGPQYLPEKIDSGVENSLSSGRSTVSGAEYLSRYFEFRCYAVQFLYRREFLETNSLRFKEGLLYEDIEWTPRVLIKAQKVSVFREVVYNYYYRIGSIARSFSKEKILRQNSNKFYIIDSLKSLPEQLDDNKWQSGVKSWCDAMIASIAEGLLTTTARHLYSEVPTVIESLKERKLLPIDSRRMTKTGKRRVLIINLFSAQFYCWLMHLL